MNCASNNESKFCGCFPEKIHNYTLCAIVLLFSIAVAVIVPTVYYSFHVITYDQMAFKRDIYGQVDTSTVYKQGRYFAPLTQTFVTFDATFEPVKYLQSNGNALAVALSNGVQINIDLIFEYRVQEQQLANLYNQYSTTYLSQITTVAEAAIKSVVIQFNEMDYVQNRLYITATIGAAVQNKLNQEIYVYAPADKFQLLNVYFPDSVVSKNLEAAMEIQNNEVATIQQVVVGIQSETSREVAEIDAESAQVVAIAQVTANQIIQQAKNTAANIAIESRAIGLGAFFNTLSVSDPQVQKQLITYLDILDANGSIKLLSFGQQNQTFVPFIQS